MLEQKTLEQNTLEQKTLEPMMLSQKTRNSVERISLFLTWTCWGREYIPTAAVASVSVAVVVVVVVVDNVVVGDNLFRKPVLRRAES